MRLQWCQVTGAVEKDTEGKQKSVCKNTALERVKKEIQENRLWIPHLIKI